MYKALQAIWRVLRSKSETEAQQIVADYKASLKG